MYARRKTSPLGTDDVNVRVRAVIIGLMANGSIIDDDDSDNDNTDLIATLEELRFVSEAARLAMLMVCLIHAKVQF